MDFRLLGPVEVRRDGTVVPVGGPRERALLAALLLRANEVASVGYLVESVWDRPPASPESNLRTYVAGLRRKLGGLPDGSGRLVTRTGGYQLVVGPGELDVAAFDELRCGAELALRDGDLAAAVDQFERALRQWNGVTPLAGLRPGPQLRAELARLVERRLTTVERYLQARLDLGQHRDVVDELQFVVARHPLREELWALLMVALCRSGRRAEALDAYTRARARLVEDLGIEPGPRLRAAHDGVLNNDPALAADAIPAAGPLPGAAPPAQLPADVPDFVGRADTLDLVVGLLGDRPGDDPPPLVVMFGGAGVGKSALAVHAARRVSPSFPDGQLYLDLAGMSDEPRDPALLLADVLRSLGLTGAAIPDGLQARASLARTLLAGRRILLLLDDAAHADQVRPLVPPDGGCAVVITSRRPLTELTGATHVELDVLPPREAHQLFARIVGPDRVAAEPDHAAAILDACGHLPLAIRIAAGKLVSRPAWTLRVLRERLADESDRLTQLQLGDLGVRAHREAAILREASALYDRRGEPDRAVSYLRRALDIFTSLDDQQCVGYTLLRTGPLHARHGNPAQATSDLEHAAAIFARNGSRPLRHRAGTPPPQLRVQPLALHRRDRQGRVNQRQVSRARLNAVRVAVFAPHVTVLAAHDANTAMPRANTPVSRIGQRRLS